MATSTLSLRRRLVTILPDWGSFLGSFYRDTGKNYDHDRADHNDTYGDVRDLYFGGHGSANLGQVQLTAVYGTCPRLRLPLRRLGTADSFSQNGIHVFCRVGHPTHFSGKKSPIIFSHLMPFSSCTAPIPNLALISRNPWMPKS